MRLIFRNSSFRWILLILFLSEVDVVGQFGVYSLTNLIYPDTRWVVSIAIGTGISLVLFSLIAGVAVDRVDKRRLLIMGLIAQIMLSAVVAYLMATDQFAWWQMVAVEFVRVPIWAVKMTAFRTLIMDIVGDVNLLAANALTNLASAFMRGFGTLVVGTWLWYGSIGAPFVVTALAGVAAIVLLRRMQVVESQIRTDLASPLEDLRAGLRYVVSNPIVWTLLILGLVLEVFGWNYQQILAERAFNFWEYSLTSWGFVDLAGGIGALASVLILSIRRDIKGQPRLMMAAYILMAVSVMFFAWSPWLVLFAVLMAIAYFMRTSFYAIMDTLLQTRVSDEMRGRVLGFQFVLVAFSNTRIWQTWSISDQPAGLSLGYVGVWIRWAFISLLGVKVAITLGSGIVAAAGLIMLRGMSATYREEPATESED